jgi:hypothetical protein
LFYPERFLHKQHSSLMKVSSPDRSGSETAEHRIFAVAIPA